MVGTTLFGRYKIVKIIGQGGMGTVYLAEDIVAEQVIAIKEISVKNKNRSFVLKEPLLLKKLDHPSIIKVIGILEAEEHVYILMDYVEGRSLKEALIKEKKFSEKQVLHWTTQLCLVLEYLHNRTPYPIIYRDMKPSNILVDKHDQITLIDFGIACEYREDGFEDEQVALTRGYCAPEQYIEKTFDVRSDIYSLGVTMYHLLTGVSPNDSNFELVPIKKVDENISREMEYIVTRATRLDPDERYQCIEDFHYDLINIHKLNKDLKKIIIKQVLVYSLFLVLYVVFGLITYAGFQSIQRETTQLSTKMITEGDDYLAQGYLDQAYERFTNVLKLDGANVSAFMGMFQYYDQSDKSKEGINYIKLHLDEFKKNPDLIDLSILGNFYMGKFYLKMGDYPNAKFRFYEAYKLDPRNNDIVYAIALSHLNLEEFQAADKFIHVLLEEKYDDTKIYFLYGEKNRVEQNYTEAIQYYDEAIQKNTDIQTVCDSYVQKAQIYKTQKELYPDGEKLYMLTLEQASKALGDKTSVMIILLKAEQYEKNAENTTGKEKISNIKLAIDNYNKTLRMGKNDLESYIKIAYLYKSIDDYDAAEQTLMKATEQYSNTFLSYYHLTVIEFEKELKKDEMLRDFTQAKKNYEITKELANKQGMNHEIRPLTESIDKIFGK